MNAATSPHQFVRSGGDDIPRRPHLPTHHCRPSLAVRKSPSAIIQPLFSRVCGATFTHLHKSSPTGIPSSSVRVNLTEDAPSLALVGVVGQEFLSDRSFEMLASKSSAGKRNEYVVEELEAESFNSIPALSGSISKQFGPIVVDSGSIVVDNGLAYRIKARDLIKLGGALIANHNCLMAATPLHLRAKVLRVAVSTYQAASGAGEAAMEELERQTREVLEGKQPTCNIFKQQYAFNLFSHNAPVLSNGYNEEEMKLVKETRKIWNDTNVKVTATCIRVPVMRAHAKSVNLQFEMPFDEYAARDILRNAPGVVVIDDREANHFPTPLEVSNKDDVVVGRICSDVSQDGNYGLDIFVCGDQIRQGATLNAVQIVEML